MASDPDLYRVVLRDLAASTFGWGDVIAEFENAKNIGYAEYVNDVGEAFCTISQGDPKAALIRTKIEDGVHFLVYRGTDLVWGGWLAETDETPTDVILHAYNYAAGFFELHTGWAQEWNSQTIQTIVTALWDRAKAATNSRMAWMTTGTIQSPVTTSGGAIAYTQPLYKTYYKRILFAVQELAAASISDTTNRVVWEITPDGTFNLWKNRGAQKDNLRWTWGDPRILGYRRLRTPTDRRNVLLGVGTSPRDVTLLTTQEDTSDQASRGRREEAIYLQWVRGQGELERVTKFRLKRARRVDQQFFLTFAPDALVPFRATGASYILTDTVPVDIDNGVTNVNTDLMILGQQVLVYKGKEIVRPLLGDRL